METILEVNKEPESLEAVHTHTHTHTHTGNLMNIKIINNEKIMYIVYMWAVYIVFLCVKKGEIKWRINK